jgi:hypothetical protein
MSQITQPNDNPTRPQTTYHPRNGFNFVGYSTTPLQSKSQSQTYLDNSVPNAIKPQLREPENLPKRNNRAAKFTPNYEILVQKTRTKNRLSKLFRANGKTDVANKMRDCSNFFDILTSGQCIKRTTTTFFCSSRHCPFCAEIRARELQEDYLPKLESFAKENPSLDACHLVLTQKQYKGESLLNSIKRLLKNFEKMRRRAVWSEYFDAGGLYGVEFTKGRHGWHTHLHCEVFRSKFLNVNQFRAAWLDVTGDSMNFKIKRIDTLKGGLEEIIKYISKPKDVANYTVSDVEQLSELKGVKLFGTFGRFRKFCASYQMPTSDASELKIDIDAEPLIEGDLCECCGLTLFRLRLDIKGRIELEKHVYAAKKAIRGKPMTVSRC